MFTMLDDTFFLFIVYSYVSFMFFLYLSLLE